MSSFKHYAKRADLNIEYELFRLMSFHQISFVGSIIQLSHINQSPFLFLALQSISKPEEVEPAGPVPYAGCIPRKSRRQ